MMIHPFLRFLRQILKYLTANIIIDNASCVDEAFSKIVGGTYDVVVSDYGMPRKNGLEFLELLREQGNDIPFILFTGKGTKEVAVKALNLGVNAYIDKHANPETVYGELVHGIEKTVKAARAQKFLQNKALQISAMEQAPRTILENHEFTKCARQIFDICKRLIQATSGYLALIDSTNKFNEVLFIDSGDYSCTVDKSLPMPIRGLRGEVYAQGKALYENDFVNSKWINFLPKGHVALENVLFAPIISEGKAVGVIGLANKNGGFVENDAILASYFVEITSIALLNSQALDKAEVAFNSRRMIEEELRTIFDSSPTWIFYKDKENCFIRVNQAFADAIQLSKRQIEGHSVFELFPKWQAEDYWKDDKRVIASGKPKLGIIEQMKVKDQFLWVKTDKLPYRGSGGNIIGVIGFVTDITEQRNRELTLRRMTLRFKLEDGNLYHTSEMLPIVSLEALKDLKKIGFDAVVISRTSQADFIKQIDPTVEFYWLAEHGRDHLKPDAETIKKIFEAKVKNTIFLFDGTRLFGLQNGRSRDSVSSSMVQRVRRVQRQHCIAAI